MPLNGKVLTLSLFVHERDFLIWIVKELLKELLDIAVFISQIMAMDTWIENLLTMLWMKSLIFPKVKLSTADQFQDCVVQNDNKMQAAYTLYDKFTDWLIQAFRVHLFLRKSKG